MKSLLVVALALTGCVGNYAHPRIDATVPGEPRANTVTVGHPILVAGDWGRDQCHHYNHRMNAVDWIFASPRERAHDNGSSGTSCSHEVPNHLTLQCSAPCNIWNDRTVTPTTPGPLTVYATITRDDTGEKSRQAFQYDVVAAR